MNGNVNEGQIGPDEQPSPTASDEAAWAVEKELGATLDALRKEKDTIMVELASRLHVSLPMLTKQLELGDRLKEIEVKIAELEGKPKPKAEPPLEADDDEPLGLEVETAPSPTEDPIESPSELEHARVIEKMNEELEEEQSRADAAEARAAAAEACATAAERKVGKVMLALAYADFGGEDVGFGDIADCVGFEEGSCLPGDETLDEWVRRNYGDTFDWELLSTMSPAEQQSAHELLPDFRVLDDDGDAEVGIAIVERDED